MFATYLPAVSWTGMSSGMSSASAMRCSAAASVDGKLSLKCWRSSAAKFPSATPNNNPFCALVLGFCDGNEESLVLGMSVGVLFGKLVG